MANTGLLIFVEGPDDDRFVKRIFYDILSTRYSWVKTFQYSRKKPVSVCSYVHSIISMNSDYIFFVDLDFCPCISKKKDIILNQYPCLDKKKIIVVKKEIECWYLAGINDEDIKAFGLNDFRSTDGLDKEIFKLKIPKEYVFRVDFMQEICSRYSIPTAIIKNTSFRYFVEKHRIL